MEQPSEVPTVHSKEERRPPASPFNTHHCYSRHRPRRHGVIGQKIHLFVPGFTNKLLKQW